VPEVSAKGFNLNTVAILVSFVGMIGGGAIGVAKIVYVVTTKADAINARLDNVEGRLSRAETAAAEAKGAAAEAEKTSTSMIRELRYKEEQDQNRELRQLARAQPARRGK
jgi:F0F1-type ATP synthase membrane subunit b/b'